MSWAEGCTTPAQFGALVLRHQPAELLADLAEPAAFLRVFNAVPPVSAVEADRVMVFRRPGAPVDLIGFFTGGCLTLWATLRGAVVDRLIPGALGLPS